MLELLVNKLIEEGKVSREEIDAKILELKYAQPRITDDLTSLKNRQDESENAILKLMELSLIGGM